jgi:hypothetical protein
MGQSPSLEASSHLASGEIPWILLNLKVHYCLHKCLPLTPSRARGVQSTTPLPKIHSNIIFPSTPMSSEWSLSLFFAGLRTKIYSIMERYVKY